MSTKTQMSMWFESIVLHMALTVRALSPQTQLRPLNSYYVSFPWHQAHTKHLFSLYFEITYNEEKKKKTTLDQELKECTVPQKPGRETESLHVSCHQFKADQHAHRSFHTLNWLLISHF